MKIFTFTVLILMMVSVVGLFSCSQAKKESVQDQLVLDELKKAGSNLSKPHEIDFYLYFPTEESANRAAEEARREGFSVKVRMGVDGFAWLCLANREMVPEHSEIVRIGTRFHEIALKFKGEYDGWESGVVK